MKKVIFIYLLFIPCYLMASDSLSMKVFAIKTDLIAAIVPFVGSNEFYFSLTPEKSIAKKQSIQLQLFYDHYYPNDETTTIEIVPEYKYYFGKLCKSFFTGVYLKYEWYDTNFYEAYFQYSTYYVPPELHRADFIRETIGGGVIGGYERLIKNHLLVEFILGFGVRQTIFTKTLNAPSGAFIDNTTDDGVVSLNIGYKF